MHYLISEIKEMCHFMKAVQLYIACHVTFEDRYYFSAPGNTKRL